MRTCLQLARRACCEGAIATKMTRSLVHWWDDQPPPVLCDTGLAGLFFSVCNSKVAIWNCSIAPAILKIYKSGHQLSYLLLTWLLIMVLKIRSVAVIGAGPAGAIATDALVKEQAFETIRVFERKDVIGGAW